MDGACHSRVVEEDYVGRGESSISRDKDGSSLMCPPMAEHESVNLQGTIHVEKS